MVLNARNKTFGNYTDKKHHCLKITCFAALAGTTWFLQFFFYGMGESKMGNGASSWIFAHGLYYTDSQHVGPGIKGMERCK